MNTINSLKTISEKFPYAIGSKLALVPFSLRFGKSYNNFKKEIQNEKSRLSYAIHHFSKIFNYAKSNFQFYQDLYQQHGVFDLEIKTLDDILKIPVITKDQIRNHVKIFRGSLLINTGGTSGEPFSFYVDKQAYSREWAHLHTVWEYKGYNYKDLKVTLRGKDLGSRPYRYNPVHNEFIINTYLNAKEIKNDIIKIFRKYKIKYIHGYPSTIYNFLYELEENINKNEQSIITKNLRSCFFGSEYPTAQITKYIEDKWGLDYISWYGHSEMCIMAYDLDKTNMYKPFFTYGFPEQVDNKLIGTSFHNYDMPLIRYDTGDIINADYSNDGLISTFSITNGRVGEYIIDANNKSIPLTALIFGRHHKVFDYARFIQVKQIKPGSVTFYITTDKNNKNEVITDLNMNNTSIKFDVELIPKPILTRSGKVCLKINN